MIDTMFFLLVFFLLSSLDIISTTGPHVNLPKALTAVTPRKKADMTVSVLPGGSIQIDNFTYEPKDVGAVLVRTGQKSGLLPQSRDPKVIEARAKNLIIVISADAKTENAAVVKAIDSARAQGFTHFGIAAKGRATIEQNPDAGQ